MYHNVKLIAITYHFLVLAVLLLTFSFQQQRQQRYGFSQRHLSPKHCSTNLVLSFLLGNQRESLSWRNSFFFKFFLICFSYKLKICLFLYIFLKSFSSHFLILLINNWDFLRHEVSSLWLLFDCSNPTLIYHKAHTNYV